MSNTGADLDISGFTPRGFIFCVALPAIARRMDAEGMSKADVAKWCHLHSKLFDLALDFDMPDHWFEALNTDRKSEL